MYLAESESASCNFQESSSGATNAHSQLEINNLAQIDGITGSPSVHRISLSTCGYNRGYEDQQSR